MANFIDINSIMPTQEDQYLLDTNVILFLYNSYNNDYSKMRSKVTVYGDFFDKAIKANSKIFISSLNISEFVNVIVRREFNIERKGYSNIQDDDFKLKFRPSQAYINVMSFIRSVVPTILNGCARIDDDFSSIDILDMVKNLDNDFNDEYFAYLSNQENLKLVTDDGDFKSINIPIDIITGNRNLLN